jgi:2,4-dienoyl-CoA reductase-like NADH-dependent reductase (Old Yellow Enzyme family)/thioredoxin reductase
MASISERNVLNTRYPHIFSPLTVGKVTFKNRIFAAPAAPMHLIGRDQYPNDAVIAYYREKARGGSAALVFASTTVDSCSPEDLVHHDLMVTNLLHARRWRELTSQVHFFDAKISMELMSHDLHGLGEQGHVVAYSPSGEVSEETGEWCPAIPPAEMDRIAEEYAFAAECALAVGFDGLMIHGGHGLFLHRFMSPLFNKRTDEYGGSMANRAKFAQKILARIRERVGDRLYVEYRVSGAELWPGGFEVEDCIEFLGLIEPYIDIAHVSAGIYLGRWAKPHVVHPFIFCDPGCNAHLAAAVKQSGVTVPVVTLGAFQHPALIEETLASGKADFVAMARGTIADAQVPNKALGGREDEIIPCIKCFNCLDFEKQPEFGCSVNPTVGRELSLHFLVAPPQKSKRVVVIGGGPAGMQAALVASERGHTVTLLEKRPELGGQLLFARQVPFKYDLVKFMDYLIHAVSTAAMEVRLATEATPELVASLGPDVILAAVGSHPARPPIPGIERALPITAYYDDPRVLTAGSVVVIGGGQVGCETAIHLAMSGRRVFLVEMLPTLACDAEYVPWKGLMEKMDEYVPYYTGARCTGVTPQGISYVDAQGAEHFIEADHVLLAAGAQAAWKEAEVFRDLAPLFWRIGDCWCAGDVKNATRTAFDAASGI